MVMLRFDPAQSWHGKLCQATCESPFGIWK